MMGPNYAKLGHRGSGAGSRDPYFNFGTSLASPERPKLETRNFVCIYTWLRILSKTTQSRLFGVTSQLPTYLRNGYSYRVLHLQCVQCIRCSLCQITLASFLIAKPLSQGWPCIVVFRLKTTFFKRTLTPRVLLLNVTCVCTRHRASNVIHADDKPCR